MSYSAFTFNVESAKKADSEGGRIQETNKYVGTLTRVEFTTSQKGTKGLEVNFITDDKLETNFTIWTEKADGTPIFGVDKVNAILACTRTHGLTPTNANVEKYDFDEKKVVTKPAVIAPELSNKRIGLLLQAEQYYNSNHDVKTRMAFVACFEEASSLMAKEICEKKTVAEALPKAYERLMKNGDKTVEPQYTQTQSGGYGANPSAPNLDDGLPW